MSGRLRKDHHRTLRALQDELIDLRISDQGFAVNDRLDGLIDDLILLVTAVMVAQVGIVELEAAS